MLTRETLTELKQQGKSNAEIARMYQNEATGKPLSREWIRRLCSEWDIGSFCDCGTAIKNTERRCAACREGMKHKRYEAWKKAHQEPRDFGKRPIVEEAHRRLEGMGLDVEYNVLSKNNDPELLVCGKRIKCNAIIPVSQGHQTRLRPRSDVDAFFLSDGEIWFLIPAGDVRQKYNYIGESNDLRRFSGDKYRRQVVEGLCG